MNMQQSHKAALRKMRRQTKQIALIIRNRRHLWEDEPDAFTETLMGWRTDLKEAIRNLTQNEYPWDVEIPSPSEFRDTEDAKKFFNNLAFDYSNWLKALNAYQN